MPWAPFAVPPRCRPAAGASGGASLALRIAGVRLSAGKAVALEQRAQHIARNAQQTRRLGLVVLRNRQRRSGHGSLYPVEGSLFARIEQYFNHGADLLLQAG